MSRAPTSVVVAERRTSAAPVSGRSPVAGLLRLNGRLLRRGTAAMVLAVVGYLAVELLTFRASYPDAASRARVVDLSANPGVRVLQGIGHRADTTGGFIVWDAGWVVVALVGVWLALLTTRLLRAEEESHRAELVLVAPVTGVRATAVQLAVVLSAGVSVAAVGAVLLLAGGTGAVGSVLFGVAIAGTSATYAGVAAVLSQLFVERRRCVGFAIAAVGVSLLVRMLADSANGREWLRWLTPFGWLENLQPYAGPRWWVLVPLILVPVAMAAFALVLRRGRDYDAGQVRRETSARSHLLLLGGPAAFAWRAHRGLVRGWAAALATYAFALGALLPSIVDFIVKDPTYRRLLETMGVDLSTPTRGFVSYFGRALGLFVALAVCARVSSMRSEESSERLGLLLSRPLTRRRWLMGQAATAVIGAVVVTTATALALWSGSATVGGGLALDDAARTLGNTLPTSLFFGGVTLLLLACAPRVTAAASMTVTVAAYLLEVVGTAGDLPSWVLDLSPFHHLAAVPLEPIAWTATVWMACAAVLLTGLAALVFSRRDLAGA